MYEEYLTKALSNIIMARQALKSYSIVGQKNLKNIASYHTQQAIEILIKYLIYNSIGYNKGKSKVNQIYKHNIDYLIQNYCKPLNISIPQKIIKNSRMYSSWESESRYSLSYSVRVDSIESALNEVENWIIKIKSSYMGKILGVKRKLGLR